MVAAAGSSVPDHGFGFVFVLFGEDNVSVAYGFGRLPQSLLYTTTTDLVSRGRWCWCSSGCWHIGLSEPGGVSSMCDAGVPWYATSTLP